MKQIITTVVLAAVVFFSGVIIPQALKQTAPPIAQAGAQAASGLTFTPLTPNRMLDTRTTKPLTAGQIINVCAVNYARALDLQLTVPQAFDTGYITVWGANGGRPNASVLNYAPGMLVPVVNFVTVQATAGCVSIYAYGATHLIVDLMGMYT